MARLRAPPRVATVAGPFRAHTVSPAGTVGFAQVSYKVAALGMTKAARHVLAAAAVPGRAAGLRVETGRTAAQATPERGASELIGLIVAAVVLVITSGGFIAAGLPLLHAVLGIGISLPARGHPVHPLSASTSYVRHAVSVVRPQSGLRHSGTQMLTASSRSRDCH